VHKFAWPLHSSTWHVNAWHDTLLLQTPTKVKSPATGSVQEISPQQLGNRVLLMREELAKTVLKLVPTDIHERNMTVLRKHLEQSSYTSGTGTASSKSMRRRGVSAPISADMISYRRVSRRQGRQ
jgi:hypothetical protein